MKTKLIMFGGLVIATYFVTSKLTVVHLANAAVTATPFTAEIAISDLTGPSPRVFLRKIVARRSDGSTAEWQTHVRAGSMRRITYMDGRSYTVSDLIRARWMSQGTQQERAILKQRLSNTSSNCVVSIQKFIRWGTLLGQRVAVLEHKVGDGRTVTTFAAPKLGCEVLAHNVKQSGKLLTQSRLVKLTIADPANVLFDNGAGYKDVAKASTFLTDHIIHAGGAVEQSDPQLQKLDKEQ